MVLSGKALIFSQDGPFLKPSIEAAMESWYYLIKPLNNGRAKYPNFDRLRVNFYHMRYSL